MRWPPRGRVLKTSRRELPRKIKKDGTPHKRPNFEYQCNKCKAWFRSSDTVMDHVNPVVDTKVEFNTEEEFYGHFITSLLCYEENWQVLCNKCHDEKTKKENELRKKA
jgi:5-methylcytosine-specific restriction endonuclease McrA